MRNPNNLNDIKNTFNYKENKLQTIHFAMSATSTISKYYDQNYNNNLHV